MKRDAYVYQRPRLTKKGEPRQGWTEGTQWRAIVPLPGGGRRDFYGLTEAAVNEKVGAWRRHGGHSGEIQAKERHRYVPRADPGPEEKAVLDTPSAAAWVTDWARIGRRDAWDQRRYKDAGWLVQKYVAYEESSVNPRSPWHDLPINKVTKEAVADLLALLDDRPTTQDNLRRLLLTAFKDCEWVEGSPVPALLRAEQRKKQQKHPEPFRVLTPREWKALVAECLASADPVASAILLTLQCGLRSSETRALHWYDYDAGMNNADDMTGPIRTPVDILAELQNDDLEDHDPQKGVSATISVHAAVIRADKDRTGTSLMLSESTKTFHGKRILPVPLASQQALRLLRLREVTFHRSEEDAAAGRYTFSKEALVGHVPPITDLIWPSLGRSGDPEYTHRTRPLDSSRLNRVLDTLRAAAGIARCACPSGHDNGGGFCPTCERPMLVGDARGLDPSAAAKRPPLGEECSQCTRVGVPVCRHCNKPLVSLRVHDLRHSYCSVLLAKREVSPADICARMGWSTSPASMSAMLARYGHSTLAGQVAADEAVQALTGDLDELMAERKARLALRQEVERGGLNSDPPIR